MKTEKGLSAMQAGHITRLHPWIFMQSNTVIVYIDREFHFFSTGIRSRETIKKFRI
ncbi:MAG: hypothetical protein H7X71_05705 [Chitinophagales bacterium]|nr:hypothetical protein [Chitinophagales bacterium]